MRERGRKTLALSERPSIVRTPLKIAHPSISITVDDFGAPNSNFMNHKIQSFFAFSRKIVSIRQYIAVVACRIVCVSWLWHTKRRGFQRETYCQTDFFIRLISCRKTGSGGIFYHFFWSLSNMLRVGIGKVWKSANILILNQTDIVPNFPPLPKYQPEVNKMKKPVVDYISCRR